MTTTHTPCPNQLMTPRLVLRRWTADDVLPFAQVHDAEVVAWLGGRPFGVEQAQLFIQRTEAHFEEHGFGFWAVERRSDGSLIGISGLRRGTWEDHPLTPCVEIGWRQARSAWGHGYATEAASAVLRDGFERVKLDEIVAWTASSNARSQAVMSKIGMRPAPQLDFDHPQLAEGHPLRRHVVFTISRQLPPA